MFINPQEVNSKTFPQLVKEELIKALNKHPPINSYHEGYAVILEELDELWEEIKQQHQIPPNILKELTQIGAMCQRLAEDQQLCEKSYDNLPKDKLHDSVDDLLSFIDSNGTPICKYQKDKVSHVQITIPVELLNKLEI